MFVCKVDEDSKFAEQLDPEISIIGNEAYFLDECPDGFGGFDPIAFLIDRIRQFGNLIVVDLGQVRMTPGKSSRIDFYCTQIVKYLWRFRDKGDPLKDAKKAQRNIGHGLTSTALVSVAVRTKHLQRDG